MCDRKEVWRRSWAWSLVMFATLGLSLGAQDRGQLQPELFQQLRYRHIGPMGNRISAVVGVPGDPLTAFIGAASGGIFKTEDGGAHWRPVFDDQPVQSIGALAISPADRNVVWAGTGEAHIRSNISIGNGVYRSTDGGNSWNWVGLPDSGRISRIVAHPTDPDVAWVAVLGHCYGPQQERGVFRTLDGGGSWERVLFVDENTGASDIIIDPSNPRILYAGTWQMVIWTWGRQSGGPGSGLYKSTDGGTTWTKLTSNGLPEEPWGKVALAVSADDPSHIYALIETNSNREFASLDQHAGVLWSSNDAGKHWTLVNSDHTLAQRPHYYSRVVAAPDRHNEVYFMSTRASISQDGGRTYSPFRVAGDHHDMWIDPLDPDRMMVGHDGGLSLSLNRGATWFRPQLPIAQMYHAFTDDRIPYFVFGNRQDGSSFMGPSNTLDRGPIPIGAWSAVGGCESGFAIPDPVEDNLVWSGCYEGILDLFDRRTGHSRSVSVWPENAEAWPGKDIRYRFHWTFPIAISPHDHNRVYVGSQFVHETRNGGQSWRVISPDLSTGDVSKQQKTGGLTPDDAGPTIAAAVFAIAESPMEDGLIWAGTNDGLLHVTRDGGASWQNVTANLPGLPPWGTFSNIEPSRHQAGRCYVTVDFHQVNDPAPYVYKTEDYGRSWTRITNGLPEGPAAYAHVVREDPKREGMLFLGTESGVFVSFNDGGDWISLQANLPHAPVHWLTIQDRFSDLVVATYGRGFWILDDVSPLRQVSGSLLEHGAFLFEPREAFRFRLREPVMRQPEDPVEGDNPPYGVPIHYFLKDKPEGPVTLTILDSEGSRVREMRGRSTEMDRPYAVKAAAGLNRVFWNLRADGVEEPKLRTDPLEHDHVELGDQGWRRLIESESLELLVPPGVYTVVLKVGDQELRQNLTVLKDPNSAGSETEIMEQFAVLTDLREMISTSVDMINELEWLRRQLQDLAGLLGSKADVEEELRESLVEESRKVEEALADLEGEFFELRLSNAGQDTLRWPRRLYSRMLILAGNIGQSDFRPTDQQVEVYRMFKQNLSGLQERFKVLRDGALTDFNNRLRSSGIPNVLAGVR